LYNPAHFRERDPAVLRELVTAHPFGLLLAGDELAHLPFLVDGDELRTHAARPNPVWRRAVAGPGPVTAVFTGPNGYVSPLWYTAPEAQVPTWNYAVVHAQGKAREMGRPELRQLLVDLAARFEPPGPEAWTLDRLDPGFVEELMNEIVGLVIRVERWQGKLKLSQNRSPEDAARVAEALRTRDPALSALVSRANRASR